MRIDFSDLAPGPLPGGWESVTGDWAIREMGRPQRAEPAIAAVTSDRHIAFPGICKTKSGALVVCYREGYTHASGNPDDGRVMLVRSDDGGATWGEPWLAYDDPEYDDRNAAISCMDDGTLAIVWDKYLRGKHYWAWLTTSTDEGRTWSEARKITVQQNVHTRSRGLDLGDGTWLLPWADAEHGAETATWFTIYDPRTGELEEIQATPTGRREMADEVAVTRAPNGDLVALIRSPSEPALWQTVSSDGGRTWSEVVLSAIPSQFTPCDLITLEDGRLLCAFSFRERRNERLVVSRDNGKTWDIEDSVDVFDGTQSVGGDRSYPASVQVDADTIGTVLYETKEPPVGGRIYFVRTPISALTPERSPALYQGDMRADLAHMRLPEGLHGDALAVTYRFTGRFGAPPNRVGIVMREAEGGLTAFEFQMGTPPDIKAWPTNHVRVVRYVGDEEEVLAEGRAQGDWYNDGSEHTLSTRREGNRWVFAIDDAEQLTCEEPYWRPQGLLTMRATVACYEV